MSKRVLSIGQCGFDHGSIAATLRKHFGAEVVAADGPADAAVAIAAARPDLILVNRKLDADGGDGLDVLRGLKQDPTTADLPVMLVSNYPEFQAQAETLGAESGFGKAELARPETIDKFSRFLR